MMDEEADLRERFEELRTEDGRGVPAFSPVIRRHRPSLLPMAAPIAASLVLFAALVTVIVVRSRHTTFSATDRATVRATANWRPPTDFLLRPPGNEILSGTPVIPDVNGILPPTKGASR
jgi:hypothetical protein